MYIYTHTLYTKYIHCIHYVLYMRPWSVHQRLDFDIHSTKMWSEYLQHQTFMHIIGFISDKLYSTLYVY